MKWWYERQNRVWRDEGSLEQASTAEQLKRLLVARCPDSEAGLEIREGLKHDRLWDRLQLVVARVRGRASILSPRSVLMVCGSYCGFGFPP